MLLIPPTLAGKSHQSRKLKKESRFSPGPADQRNQAALRHPERSSYRCFLTDLAGFRDICRAGPDYADRQDRRKPARSFETIVGSKPEAPCPRTEHSNCTTTQNALSRNIPAYQQAIFLFDSRWNHARIGQNRPCHCPPPPARIG